MIRRGRGGHQRSRTAERVVIGWDDEDGEDEKFQGGPFYIWDTEDRRASRVLSAVYYDDLDTLMPFMKRKELLSAWFERARECRHGLNLLQIAILRESDDVFDYLMSLDDIYLLPLIEAEDFAGSTALVVALSYRSSIRIGGGGGGGDHPPERYAYKLIEKGADINKNSHRGWSMLHCAIARGFIRTARCLIKKGANVNGIVDVGIGGYTPLHLCFHHSNDGKSVDAIAMLLNKGADPTIPCSNGDTVFDILCRNSDNKDLHVALENVFLFAFDELLTLCVVNFESLLKLAQNNSPLFLELLGHTTKITFRGRYEVRGREHYSEFPSVDMYALYPLMIDIDYLCALLNKHPFFVKILLNNYSSCSIMYRMFDIRNIEMLLQSSSLHWDTIELISNIGCGKILSWYLDSTSSRMTNNDDDEFVEVVLPMIYYLCSYGMAIDVMDLERIYTKTGLSEDFKNLIFLLGDDEKVMDSFAVPLRPPIFRLIPRIFYDVTLDIHDEMVENRSLCMCIDWKQMFQYFVHPKIKNAYSETTTDAMIEQEGGRCFRRTMSLILLGDDIASSSSSSSSSNIHQPFNVKSIDLILPRVPLLQELSRDAFRKYFIKRFNITGAKQFHSLIKLLPISHVHEKIITFETKLYNNCIS